MTGSHYSVLGVAPDCSLDEIRRAYHNAARRLHPDKQQAPASSPGVTETETVHLFVHIQEAYEVLRDAATRRRYDEQLARDALLQQREDEAIRIADEIPLDEMVQQDGEIYVHHCRCGDVYELSQSEWDEGIDIVPCNGCSLNIRVLAST